MKNTSRLSAVLDLVDLGRYPIHELDSPSGKRFLQRCRRDMRTTGSCNLVNFIRQDGLSHLVEESNALLAHADEQSMNRTIYSSPVDMTVRKAHPRRRRFAYRRRHLASDQIGTKTALRQLYDCEVFIDFISAVQQKSKLYPMADEFQALNVIVLEDGQWQPWHFDFNECTVTLLIQQPRAGGEFTYVPDMRSAEDENYAQLQTFLDGGQSAVRTLPRSSGTLTLFRGEFALHAVSQIQGAVPRVSAILTYDESPNRVAPDSAKIQIYGLRVKKILKRRRANRT